MSIGTGFHSVDWAWGVTSAQVNWVCTFQGFK